MSTALQRQHVLAAVGQVPTHFADILTATGLRRHEVCDRLRELVASGEVIHERVDDEGMTFPMFRQADLWDGAHA
jgi:hypothetical protein